jgi:hypothetical protein
MTVDYQSKTSLCEFKSIRAVYWRLRSQNIRAVYWGLLNIRGYWYKPIWGQGELVLLLQKAHRWHKRFECTHRLHHTPSLQALKDKPCRIVDRHGLCIQLITTQAMSYLIGEFHVHSCFTMYYSELSCFNGIQMYKKETYISEISEVLTQVPCGRPQLMCKSQGILASIAAFI